MRSRDARVIYRHDKPGLCLQCRHNLGEHKSGQGIHCEAHSPALGRGINATAVYDCIRCPIDDRPILYDL